MKAFKYIFILILILIVGGAVYFALKEGGIQDEEVITIEAPTPLVYEYLSDFKNWEKWNPNVEMQNEDGALTNDVDAQVAYTYDDNETGRLKIIALDSLENVTLSFSNEDIQDLELTLDLKNTENNMTELTATVKGNRDLKNKVWSSILSDDIKEDIIPALLNPLKNINADLNEAMASYAIQAPFKTTISGGYHLYITQSTNLGNVETLKDQMESSIKNYMSQRDISATGNTKVFYENKDLNNNLALITVGIPVGEKIITEVDSQVLCGFKESEDVIKTTLKGNTKYLNEAWEKGLEFALLNGLTRTDSPVFEVYRKKMSQVYNPAEAITDVYIPVE